MTKPPGVTFAIDSPWIAVTRSVARQLGARLILGIDLEANSPSLAAVEGTTLLGGIGTGYVRALELGNEPDLYGSFAWYRTSSGTKVTGRPSGYSFSDFTTDFSNVAAALPSHVALAGPSLGTFAWTNELGQFLAAEPRVALVTLHRVSTLSAASSAVPRRAIRTVANLLSRTASIGLADRFASFVYRGSSPTMCPCASTSSTPSRAEQCPR